MCEYNIEEINKNYTFDSINDRTGFAEGDDFTSEKELREYFTVQNLYDMFQENTLSQETLNIIVEVVLYNKWMCNF